MLLRFLFVLALSTAVEHQKNQVVKVLYYIASPQWGPAIVGEQNCGADMTCDWSTNIHVQELNRELTSLQKQSRNQSFISVGVYNIHTLYQRTRHRHPFNCDLPVDLTLATSVESKTRYGPILFDAGFPHFDGNSTTHPTSSVQRHYPEAALNESNFNHNLVNFTTLVKAGSFVASDCHGGDGANANRNDVIKEIRQAGFRVDGLGKCMRSYGPEGITLPNLRNTPLNLVLKRQTIAKYMFNMAFENSIEPGYVTEKPFDALMAGTVPVYLGDASHLKALLPHPKAAIFVADFPDITALAKYLTYLTTNETAYEEHRAWRNGFTHEENIKNKPLLQISWPCKICRWAVEASGPSRSVFNNKCHRSAAAVVVGAADKTNNSNSNGGGSGSANNHHANAELRGSIITKASATLLATTVASTTLLSPGSATIPTPPPPPQGTSTATKNKWDGFVIKGSSRSIYLVENGKRRPIPDMGTFKAMNLTAIDVFVLRDVEIDAMPLAPPVTRIT